MKISELTHITNALMKSSRFYQAGRFLHPENLLYANVIAQALRDLVRDYGYSEEKWGCQNFRTHAQRWIFEPNADFPIICSWAGLHEDYVRRVVRQLEAI